VLTILAVVDADEAVLCAVDEPALMRVVDAAMRIARGCCKSEALKIQCPTTSTVKIIASLQNVFDSTGTRSFFLSPATRDRLHRTLPARAEMGQTPASCDHDDSNTRSRRTYGRKHVYKASTPHYSILDILSCPRCKCKLSRTVIERLCRQTGVERTGKRPVQLFGINCRIIETYG